MNCIKSQWFEEFHGERRVVVLNFIINFLYKSSMKNFLCLTDWYYSLLEVECDAWSLQFLLYNTMIISYVMCANWNTSLLFYVFV